MMKKSNMINKVMIFGLVTDLMNKILILFHFILFILTSKLRVKNILLSNIFDYIKIYLKNNKTKYILMNVFYLFFDWLLDKPPSAVHKI